MGIRCPLYRPEASAFSFMNHDLCGRSRVLRLAHSGHISFGDEGISSQDSIGRYPVGRYH
jgi:hypothetical protein